MKKSGKKVMLLYPPGDLYQRGEFRSQGNILDATATAPRACNDLGIVAAILKGRGYRLFLKDYQGEDPITFYSDFRSFSPDVVVITTTTATIVSDLNIVSNLKRIRWDLVVILKGALFLDSDINPGGVDYAVFLEDEFIVADLIDTHFNNQRLDHLPGVCYRYGTHWYQTAINHLSRSLDQYPFPDRTLIDNKRYVRPDTGEPVATIVTSRGCPFNCIYCLTPAVSGKALRLRSPEHILGELIECYEQYGIRNFFFKSDTFTLNHQWVVALCDLIIDSPLNGKIEWAVNSRTDTVTPELLTLMKQAGCWLIAFGYESGSGETLKKIKKGSGVVDHLRATAIARRAGLKIFGFFMIGFPWEGSTHVGATKRHLFRLKPDFLEIHLPVPYPGTPYFKMVATKKKSGYDYFNPPEIEGIFTPEQLKKIRYKMLLQYHLQPQYLFKKLILEKPSLNVAKNYIRYGFKMIKQGF